MNLDKDFIIEVLESEGTYKDKYYRLYGESVSRDKARHHINNLQRSLLLQEGITDSLEKIHQSTEAIKDTLQNQTKININSDGTQSSERLISCSEEQLKDATFLLQMHGYNPQEFELVSAGSSMWQNGSNKGNKTLYASKIKVKPISVQKNLVNLIDEVVKKYTDTNFEIDTLSCNNNINTNCNQQLLEFCIPDLHIGLSEAEEGEYSIATSKQVIYEKTMKMCKIIEESNAQDVVLAFLGDIFHYDNINKTTSKGTPQCSNVPFQTAFDTAVECVVGMINNVYNTMCKFTQHGTLRIMYVPGNHDTILGYAIMSIAMATFSKRNDDIVFDIRQQSRKFFLYGNNLIGWTHGDMDKKKLSQWLYNEAKDYISSADQIEVHCGHLHSEQVIEDNGMIIRHLPTICGVSPWEYDKGYHSRRRLTAFKWDKCEGLQQILFI